MTTANNVAALMKRDLHTFAREIELFPDEAQIWATVPGIGNAAGNLALHVAGNLQHFIGATLGNTGYVRNRDLEFSSRDVARADVLTQLSTASDVVTTTLTGFPESRLDEIYPDILGGGVRLPTGLFLMHLATHLSFHLGQAGYLRRALTGSKESSGAVSMKAIAPAS